MFSSTVALLPPSSFFFMSSEIRAPVCSKVTCCGSLVTGPFSDSVPEMIALSAASYSGSWNFVSSSVIVEVLTIFGVL